MTTETQISKKTEDDGHKAQAKPSLRIQTSNVRGIQITSVEDAARLAEGFVRSGMVPEAFKVKTEKRDERGNLVEPVDWQATTSRVMIAIIKGIEVGLPPITAMEWIIPVNNRSCIWGDGALALIENSGLLEAKKEYLEGDFKTDTWKAVCILKKKDRMEPIVREFTWKMAKDAGLTTKGKAWPSYPGRMLQMRARAWAMRDEFSEVLQGLHIAEEQQDVVDSQNVPLPMKEVQQDEFTMKALAHQPAATFDFSLLGVAKNEPVLVQQEQKAPDDPASGQSAESCTACGGKGTVPWKETNPETGELAEGIEPCRECQTKNEGDRP